jgi:hypothetical protein
LTQNCLGLASIRLVPDQLEVTSDLPQQPHLVVNATELRTGSAFRFGTLESGCWRWGKLHHNAVSIAHAVAASAAYPLFLPAIDETRTFDKGGKLNNVRVILTDGGAYDNLGLGCLWPDRWEMSASMSFLLIQSFVAREAMASGRSHHLSSLSHACSASSAPCLIAPRMLRLTGYTTCSDPAKSKASSSRISASSIGGCQPPNLVRREEAHAYPTDFNPIPAEWIERLSLGRATHYVSRPRLHSQFTPRALPELRTNARLVNRRIVMPQPPRSRVRPRHHAPNIAQVVSATGCSGSRTEIAARAAAMTRCRPNSSARVRRNNSSSSISA